MDKLGPLERIERRIYLIRGQKVMMDRDLADLYGVETKALKQAVKRNLERFPTDFIFELTAKEWRNWRSQFVTSNSDRMGLRYKPYAFTEQGVAMLSSVLKSKRAIEVNIQIMRTFSRLRRLMASHQQLSGKIDELERKHSRHEIEISTIFKVLKKLMSRPIVEEPVKRVGRIGFVKE